MRKFIFSGFALGLCLGLVIHALIVTASAQEDTVTTPAEPVKAAECPPCPVCPTVPAPIPDQEAVRKALEAIEASKQKLAPPGPKE